MGELHNGVFTIDGYNTNDYNCLFQVFRKDLLDSNLPNFRPVGFKLANTSLSSVDNISKIPGIGLSYSEIGYALNSICLSKRDGNMPNILKSSPLEHIIEKSCSFISIFDNSMIYNGKGSSVKVETLDKSLNLFSDIRVSLSISVVLFEGTGERSFLDNELLLNNTGYKSVRTDYSLNDVFSVRSYNFGDMCLYFNYKKDVNESVLCDIINSYISNNGGEFRSV